MRRKYSPFASSCLVRYTAMREAREMEGDTFDSIDGEVVLTPQEVAAVLGTSTTTVAKLVRSGRLQARTVGGNVSRFLERDVLSFIGGANEAST